MKYRFTYSEKEEKLRKSLLKGIKSILLKKEEDDKETSGEEEVYSISLRIQKILDIVNRKSIKQGYMLFFIMYDITSNKVRNLIAKYLIKRGCIRIQKSIFLANLHSSVCEKIRTDLAEVQSAYDNEDSILIVPISEGYLDAMCIIGQSIDMDVIMHRKNTLFF